MSEKIQVVSAVIVERGRVLLTQRDPLRSDYGWEWETPGGKVHEDESLEDALARELREELDVDARFAVNPLARYDFAPGDKGGRVFRAVSITFLRVTRMAGTPKPKQALGLGWFLPEELGGLRLIPGTQHFASQLEAILFQDRGAPASVVQHERLKQAPAVAAGKKFAS